MAAEVNDPGCSFEEVLTKELEKINKDRTARGVIRSRDASAGAGTGSAAEPLSHPTSGTPADANPTETDVPGRRFNLAKKAMAKGAEGFLKLFGNVKLKREEKQLQNPQANALEMGLMGLVISGGGIRSASFGLGILQALSDKGLLRHIDYLSTVSGGGYIGSWLISWIHNPLPDAKLPDAKSKFEYVQDSLRSEESDQPTNHVEPVQNLRRYSNYVTPNVSFFSADAWTLATVWSRNTLLNLIIIVCGIATLLLLPRFAGYGLHMVNKQAEAASILPDTSDLTFTWPEMRTWIEMFTIEMFTWVELMFIGVPLLIAISSLGSNLRRVGSGKLGVFGHKGVQLTIVVPTVIATATFAEALIRIPSLLVDRWLIIPWIILSLSFFMIAVWGDFPRCFERHHQNSRIRNPWIRLVLGSILIIVVSIITGLVTASMLHGVAILFSSAPNGPIPEDLRPWALLCLGPPILLFVLSLGIVLQIGLMGHDLPDFSREWLGRLRAWTMIYSIGWLALTGISLFGPYLLYWAGSAGTIGIGAVWSAVSAIGVFAGKSAKTKGDLESDNRDWKHFALELVSKVAPFVFIIGFAVVVAIGIHELLSPDLSPAEETLRPKTITIDGNPEQITLTIGEMPKTPNYFQGRKEAYISDLNATDVGTWSSPSNIDFYNLSSLFMLVTITCLILSWRVDINEFSMH